MPLWAQTVGNFIPTTHAMRIVRGMLLKGAGWSEIAPEMWPMALFTVVVIVFAVWRYRETLD
jgi:ABC-2 type transport system permease protein